MKKVPERQTEIKVEPVGYKRSHRNRNKKIGRNMDFGNRPFGVHSG
jgi:hypothetical protein